MKDFYSPKSLKYRDIKGKIRTLTPCSIVDREHLKAEMHILMEALCNYPDPELSFIDVYTTDLEISGLVDTVLRLAGVDPSTIDHNHLFTFLLPHTIEEDGETVSKPYGVIAEVNGFTTGDVGLVSEQEQRAAYYELLAQLWSLNGDIQSALKAAKEIPADVLLEMMKELSYIKAGPEGQKIKLKKKSMEKVKEMMGDLNLPINNGGQHFDPNNSRPKGS